MRTFDGTVQPESCYPPKQDVIGGGGGDKSWEPWILGAKKADDHKE